MRHYVMSDIEIYPFDCDITDYEFAFDTTPFYTHVAYYVLSRGHTLLNVQNTPHTT